MAFEAPWDQAIASQPVGTTGQDAMARGFTEPATQQSADVPSAAQNAPPEQGDGASFNTEQMEFDVPGVDGSSVPLDSTPYEPPGVGPDIPWDATPAETNALHGEDHGAGKFFNTWTPQETGPMLTRDTQVPSWAHGQETDNYGRLLQTDIGRPEHDMYQTNEREFSPRWIGYEERPLFNNIASPAPYIESVKPDEYVPTAGYPDLSRNSFGAENYVSPPDPQQIIPAYASYTEPQGEWE